MSKYKISDSGDGRKYFTMMPNVIDDMHLSPFAFRLYLHLKRVAGDDGKCYQSTETLSKACEMSAGSVSKAKLELVSKSLIEIKIISGDHGEFYRHEITIIDIWKINAETFACSPHEQDVFTTSDGPSDYVNRTVSPHETKKNLIKNNLTEEEHKNLPPPAEKSPPQNQEDELIKNTVTDLFHLSPNWDTKSNRDWLLWAKAQKTEDFETFNNWWFDKYWLGKDKQQYPSLKQIREMWLQAFQAPLTPERRDELDRQKYVSGPLAEYIEH